MAYPQTVRKWRARHPSVYVWLPHRQGSVEFNPEDAAVVHMIFEEYLSGMGGSAIARILRTMNVPKVRTGDLKSQRVLEIFRNEKYKGENRCKTPHATEDEVKQRFLNTVNALMGGRDELIANCRFAKQDLCDCSEIDAQLAELGQEIEMVTELSKKAIYENARVAVSQDEFNERNNSYLERHRKATERVAELEGLRRERQGRLLTLDGFMRAIETRPLVLEEFDEKLWVVAVEKITVTTKGKAVFGFRGGIEIEG